MCSSNEALIGPIQPLLAVIESDLPGISQVNTLMTVIFVCVRAMKPNRIHSTSTSCD